MKLNSKSELILKVTDVVRKGWNNRNLRDLIDSLWRDPWSHRTSGFETERAPDSLVDVTIDDGKIYVTIEPVGNKFSFFQYKYSLAYFKKYAAETISFDAAEGLHCVYYDMDKTLQAPILKHLLDPDFDTRVRLLQVGVTIAFLYYDSTSGLIIYQGDNRHGSWWNPWMRQVMQMAKSSTRESGIEFTDIVADADGSSDTHAEFGITAGLCFHNDMPFTADAVGSPANLPVFYFNGSNHPRIHTGSANSLVNDGRLCYNTGGAAVEAGSGKFVLYHIFFTDCTLYPHISVMGQAAYDTIGNAKINIGPELTAIRKMLPHQHLLHVGTLILETSDDFTNSYKSRVVFQINNVQTRWSIEGDGTNAKPVQLLNDEESPGALKYYGTNSAQGKGYHSLQSVIHNSIAFFKEAYLIENTTETGITQMSSWTVLAFNELVGNFKAVVMVHDKTTKAIVTLQNTFGFDYTDVLDEAADDNAIISDGTITLALSVDSATRLLKAVVTGMTGNGKRIHFCFERCVLGSRIVAMEGDVEMSLEMEGLIDLLAELTGDTEMALTMEATIEMLLNLGGVFGTKLDMEGELGVILELQASSEMNFGMEGIVGLLAEMAGGAEFSNTMEGVLDLLAELIGNFDSSLAVDGELGLLLEMQAAPEIGLGMAGTLITEEPLPIRLYNWYAITNAKGITLEEEFHIASEQDWASLLAYLGGYGVAGGKLKATSGWNVPNTGATDEFGFKGLPDGKRSNAGVFSDLYDKAHFWVKNINEEE